jgi:hypothetical protein
MRKDLRLGGIIGIYLIFKQSSDIVGEEITRVVVEELFTTLGEFETQEMLFMRCALEIVALLGPNERSV